jgi:2-isopropylmalate synthase
MTERLFLFDTTLRDGQQTQGVQFSVAEKGQIAWARDALGVDYIEGGWPGANPTDSDFFADAAPDPRHDDRVRDDQSGRPVDDFDPAKLEALQ